MATTLQQKILIKLSDGHLTHAPLKSFGGFGSGERCHGCGEPVLDLQDCAGEVSLEH
jgi:hypothetical protein